MKMAEMKEDKKQPGTRDTVEANELDYNAAAQKAKTLLEDSKYSYLREPDFIGQRNLIPMMYLNKRSDYFIGEVFGDNGRGMQAGMIDALRILALLTDEDYALQYLGKELSLPDLKDAIADYMIQHRLPELKSNEEIMKELEEARNRFESELNFLKEERQRTADFYDKYFGSMEKRQNTLDEVSQKNADLASRLAVADKEKEIEKLKTELDACKKELEQAREYAAGKPVEENQAKAGASEDKPAPSLPDGLKNSASKGAFGKREDRRRAELLVEVISDKNRSPEQFDVIADAFTKGLPYKALDTLCKADVPLENLKILEQLLLRNELGIYAGKE